MVLHAQAFQDELLERGGGTTQTVNRKSAGVLQRVTGAVLPIKGASGYEKSQT